MKERYNYTVNYLIKQGEPIEYSFEELNSLIYDDQNSASSLRNGSLISQKVLDEIEKIKNYCSSAGNYDSFVSLLNEQRSLISSGNFSDQEKEHLNTFMDIFHETTLADLQFLNEGLGIVDIQNDENLRYRACGFWGSVCVGACTATLATIGAAGAGPGGALIGAVGGFIYCKWCICCPSTRPDNTNCG